MNICGDRLVINYRKVFKELLKQIETVWIPKYEAYKSDPNNKNGMYFEVQNQEKYVDGKVDRENTGIDMTDTYTRRLKDKCATLIGKCDDMNYRGEGRFAG